MAPNYVALRNALKKRKPTFRRVQGHQFPKLREVKWRRPKGMGNKVRRNHRGKPAMVSHGYRSPKPARGLNRAGYQEVVVETPAMLQNIESKTQQAVIGSTVGKRKRLAILQEGKKLGVSFANVKDVDAAIEACTKKSSKEKSSKKTQQKDVETKESEKKSQQQEGEQ